MPTQVIGMQAAGTGGVENAAAQIDIPTDGFITGVDWDLIAHLDADDEATEVELSFISTNQLSSNDVRGRISSVGSMMTLTTSGIANTGVQKFVGPLDLPVAGGERLYLHIEASAGVETTVKCNIHLDVAAPTRRLARRT